MPRPYRWTCGVGNKPIGQAARRNLVEIGHSWSPLDVDIAAPPTRVDLGDGVDGAHDGGGRVGGCLPPGVANYAQGSQDPVHIRAPRALFAVHVVTSNMVPRKAP